MFSLINSALARVVGTNPTGLQINPPTLPGGQVLPDSICALLNNITDFLLLIVAPLAGLMILWAAFQILTASGDPAKFATGKRTLVYALVGLGIVILSEGIVAIVIGLLDQPGSICSP